MHFKKNSGIHLYNEFIKNNAMLIYNNANDMPNIHYTYMWLQVQCTTLNDECTLFCP